MRLSIKAGSVAALMLAAGCNVTVNNDSIENQADALADGIENVAEGAGNRVDRAADSIENQAGRVGAAIENQAEALDSIDVDVSARGDANGSEGNGQ